MADTTTLYKLIVLQMLEQADAPLSGSHILEFILGKEYTNYFSLQQVLSELQESGLVTVSSMPGTSLYHMTDAGRDTLRYFRKKISRDIRQDIRLYLQEKKLEIRDSLSVTADYFQGNGEDFLVRCQVRERESTLVEVTLSVPTEQQAQSVCGHWKEKSQELYAYLMRQLL